MAQQKKVEEALRESEERFRFLFETLTLGVVYQDRNGEILRANPAAERILGLTLDQMQGRTSLDPHWRAIHEDGSDFPGETHPAMKALETGREVKDVVMGVYHPATEDYVWITTKPSLNSGRGKIGLVRFMPPLKRSPKRNKSWMRSNCWPGFPVRIPTS